MSEEPFSTPQSSDNQTGTVEATTEVVADASPKPESDVISIEYKVGEESKKVIKNHVLCAMGAGLIPIPLVDIASVTAIQVSALRRLAELHDIDYSEGGAQSIVTGLAGSTLARLGASVVKVIPGVGTAVGGVSMAALSGASTYAVCQVALKHFKTKGTFLDFDVNDARKAYDSALDKGKEFVNSLDIEGKKEFLKKKYEEVQKLQKQVDSGKISEDEFYTKQEDIVDDTDDSNTPKPS